MKKTTYILFFLSTIHFLSCSSEKAENKNNAPSKFFDTTIVKSQIQPNILCKNDSGISFALYLPSTYSTTGFSPIVIFFDANAKGVFPIEKYKQIAEKFGWIIAGSNNSKNGMITDATNAIGKKLKTDLLQRFSIDEKQIYVAGFSGGARVAGVFAKTDASISGVIACSAGIGADGLLQKQFNYIGITGTKDMNYNEMATLEKTLEKSAVKHFLLTFEGKHEWAPAETMEDAFLWLYLNAVKEKRTSLNNQFSNTFYSTNAIQIKTKIKNKEYFQALNIAKKTAEFLNGVTDVAEFQKQIAELEEMPEIKKALDEKQKTENKEQALQQAYLQAFQNKDATWWKTEIAKLNERASNNTNQFETAMLCRVQGFLSLVSYSYVNRALQSGDIGTAEHFNTIYGIVDPTIPDHEFFNACIFAKKSDKKNVFISLHKAIELGLDDETRITESDFLKPFAAENEFIEIIREIKMKK